MCVMPCLRVGGHFLAESTIVMEERIHWMFECSGIRSNRWGGIVTHLQLFKKLFLKEPITLTHK